MTQKVVKSKSELETIIRNAPPDIKNQKTDSSMETSSIVSSGG